ncbi:MAG TPA: hypothetical protein VOA19_10365 [Actinomycetes bacterium]|nr:hypothetical protein [Actinomycetes bacterium]
MAREGLEAALFMIAAATTEDGWAVLIVFAAGLVSRTVLWLQAAGDLGTVWNNVYDLTAYRWLTVTTESGRFLGAMFGWDPRPSIEQVVAYLAFLVTVAWLFLRAPRPAREREKALR